MVHTVEAYVQYAACAVHWLKLHADHIFLPIIKKKGAVGRNRLRKSSGENLKLMKNFLRPVSSAVCMALVAGVLNAAPLEFFEDFDSTISYGTSVPEGWVTEGTNPFKVYPAEWTGYPAESGDNILFTGTCSTVRNEIVYTPMLKLAGGKECTVSFSFIAPGGNPSTVKNLGLLVKAGTAQNSEAQTIDVGEVECKAYASWTDFSFSFTPEADGEYCVSFWLHQETSLNMLGDAGIENVEILGESPSEAPDIILEPDPENEADAVELPYIEDFEGDNYDGTSYLPVHWASTGTQPFVTAGISGVPATSGDYYAVTQYSSEVRDERLYTPFFVLTAGTEYTVSYQLYLPGQEWGSDGITRMTDVDITVGCQQDADFHKSLDKITGYANTAFEKREVKFTPEVSGAYCFSFALSSETPYAGNVAIDDFSITAPGLTPSPKAKFAVNHNYDVMTSNLAVFPGQPVELCNLSEYGETYEWSVDSDNAEFSSTTAENPTITFSAEGEYKVTLKVTNPRTTRSTTKTLNVTYFDQSGATPALQNNAPDDEMITRGMVPTFGDTDYDFVTGPNMYYRRYAERFALPADKELTLTTLNLCMTNIHYKTINNTRDPQFAVPFTLAFYGETDGKLDESKEFGRYTSTMAEVFGTTGVGAGYGEPLSLSFADEPIVLKGTCYVTFTIGDSFDMVVDDPNVGCSYMGLAAVKHTSKATTLYAYPTALPEVSRATLNDWNRVDLIDPALKGFGLWVTLWTKTNDVDAIALASDGSVAFAVLLQGSNLIVSGTAAGEAVKIYGVNGALAAEAVGCDGSTTVNVAALPSGVYIVKTAAGVRKFVK